MADSKRQRIVVGVGGSAAGLTALRWAADESRLRGARLHVVRAWDPIRHSAPYATIGGRPNCDEDHGAARDGLAATLQTALGTPAPAGLTAELAEGLPERVLVARSADADLLVLGMTTSGPPTGRSAGPIIRTCLMRARCPVVVVRSGNDLRPPADREFAAASP
jgi:nucleotide-binding universal stress UspA family protein